jgi:nitrite reductase (NO-forming)
MTDVRDGWVMTAVGVAMACLLISVVAVGIAVRYADDDGSAAGTGGPPVTFEVELGELYVRPASIEAPAGSPVILKVTNAGTMPHDLKVQGAEGTDMLNPGESAEVTVGPFDADTQAWCTVPGHKEGGMLMDIAVTGSTDGGAVAGAATEAATGAAIDFNAEPSDGWKPFDASLQPAPGGTNHQISLTAEETVIEVAPGVTQELWTFNGQYPGPVLRGKVGDIFTVNLVNNGKLGHSIDFHASKVAWNEEMRTIEPGESLVYQFEAKHAGMFMYHCGTAPALHHIGNGMFGALIVDPPGLAPVDHEYVFVQSEIYTGPEGEPGDLAKMQEDRWDAVVFNGYVNQYKHVPIRVEPGQRIRAWVLNAGPSENSSFHIVGTIFDTSYKEGAVLLQADATRGGAQALDLQPAQGGYVEFTFDEAGLYPIVTHKFSNVGKGALGLFQAGEVTTTGAAGH